MRITTCNVNGIRAAERKGFLPWLAKAAPDVLCLQETKAQVAQLNACLTAPDGYHAFYCDAEKKGYSGVAVWSRQTPDRVIRGLGWPDFDAEGRYLQVDFGKLSVVSLYLPSGTTGDVRQQVKFEVLDRFAETLNGYRRKRREFVICGDFNIAHKQIDIRNWRSNQKSSGFLPEERAWLDHVFDDLGYVDAFREINAEPDQYTWWSNRANAWANNVGWRIDYQVLSPRLAGSVRAAEIYRGEKFSDHAPLTIDYDFGALEPALSASHI